MDTATDPAFLLVEELQAAARLPPPRERRRIRRAAGASLRDIAASVKTTPETVRRWEAGATPRRHRAVAYAALLDALEQATLK
jgi:DNA-binding transcriptional regulator YiaG